MKIKIRQRVSLKADLATYSEDTKKDMRLYKIGEVIDNVSEDYRARFEKARDLIEIIDETVEEELTPEMIIKNKDKEIDELKAEIERLKAEDKEIEELNLETLNKSELKEIATANGIEFKSDIKIEELRALLNDRIR